RGDGHGRGAAELVVRHRERDLRLPHREGTAEAAAEVGPRQRPDRGARGLEQPPRRVVDVQLPEHVARIVIAQLDAVVSARRRDTLRVEEGGELPDRERLDAEQLGEVVRGHRRARARRRDDRCVARERPGEGPRDPERPLLFAKWPNTLIASGDPIRIPSISQKVDYEAELGVVIGRRASRVSADDALDVVEGYVVANDVSGRDLQFSDGQWVRGKSLDTFLPVSDLVPRGEVPDPQALGIRAILNGETMQDSNTSN